jgi:hypothetical protein
VRVGRATRANSIRLLCAVCPSVMRDSSVNRVLHALLTGSNLRFLDSSIAHRCSLLSTGSTTNTSRIVPSVVTVTSKTTVPAGGMAVDGGEYSYFDSVTISFGGMRHRSMRSPPAVATFAQLTSEAPSNSFASTRITPPLTRSARFRARSG